MGPVYGTSRNWGSLFKVLHPSQPCLEVAVSRKPVSRLTVSGGPVCLEKARVQSTEYRVRVEKARVSFPKPICGLPKDFL